MMFRLLAPVVFHSTTEARRILTGQMRPACIAAWKAIGRSRMGLEFAYLPFVFEGAPLALSSRLRADGVIAIEVAPDDARHPDRIVTADAHKQALERARKKGGH